MDKYLFVDASLAGLALSYVDALPTPDKLEAFWPAHQYKIEADQLASSGLLTRFYKSFLPQASGFNRLVCAVGPGSFTGIRVGLAWAFGYICASEGGVEIAGASSLACAFSELQRKRPDPELFLCWPNTLTHAYFLHLSDDLSSNQTVLVNIGNRDQISSFFSAQKKYRFLSPKNWAGFSELKKTVDFDIIPMNLSEFLLNAQRGMIRQASSGQLQFGATLPQGDYQRLSTAEEKRSLPPVGP